MAITVKDILSLKSAAGFIPIAGQNGLNSSVEMVDMLDFAWENKGTYSEDLFDRYSFVVSSLLFARDDEKKLYETLRRLIECGVSGLAYKTVFFQSLPREVCALAVKGIKRLPLRTYLKERRLPRYGKGFTKSAKVLQTSSN